MISIQRRTIKAANPFQLKITPKKVAQILPAKNPIKLIKSDIESFTFLTLRKEVKRLLIHRFICVIIKWYKKNTPKKQGNISYTIENLAKGN